MPKEKKPVVCQSKVADRHLLYQEAVQNPKAEVKFIEKVYKEINNKKPILLREDFCGTAYLGCHWLLSDPEKKFIGVDFDRDTLLWGKENNFLRHPETEGRFKLKCKNVLDIESPSHKSLIPDVICAFNFALFFFHTRAELLKYLSIVYKTLKDDGVFITDLMGGITSIQPNKSTRKLSNGVIYEFSHSFFDPINNAIQPQITFKFKDGSKLKSCFSYDWRLWSLIDIREALEEVGFQNITVWFPHGEEDEEIYYEPVTQAEQKEHWNCYIVCTK